MSLIVHCQAISGMNYLVYMGGSRVATLGGQFGVTSWREKIDFK